MTFPWRLLLTQAPLVLALVLVGWGAQRTIATLGQNAQSSLDDDYRSAAAAHRMSAVLAQMHDDALLRAAGIQPSGDPRSLRERFEAELAGQRQHISEPGEEEVTRRLEAAWRRYLATEDEVLRGPLSREALLGPLQDAAHAVQSAAEELLHINQEAMRRKSIEAGLMADRFKTLLAIATGVALVLGMIASASLTRRSVGELVRAQRTTQAAIDSLHHPVLVLSTEGAVLGLNATARALLERPEGLPDHLDDLVPEPPLRERLRAAFRHAAERGEPYLPNRLDEAVTVARGGGPRTFLPHASPLRTRDGAVNGVTVVLQDVTRLARFDQLRSDLVATVAHEFRTPLTSLQMAVHLCGDGAAGPITDEQRRLLGAARQDCTRLLDTVEEILDLSRIQAGKLELEPVPLAAGELVARALEAAAAPAAAAGVRLAAGEAGETVLAEAERTGIVLANLVGNAIRHSPRGGEVRVRTRPVDGGEPGGASGTVRFEVVDQGPGLTPEQAGRVFERFYRVPGTQGPGAGLGLYIAREIVEAHGGAIGVESAPGRGCTFWFTLPAARPARG
ncbi:MAG: ATP-binding protein [Anaeromyxobacter sp.]